jgi:hypothetical protein
MVPTDRDVPERFFRASDAAVTSIPSLTSAYAFDSDVLENSATLSSSGTPSSVLVMSRLPV